MRPPKLRLYPGISEAQRMAHERLTAMLPIRIVGDLDDFANWQAADRPLSPSEEAIAADEERGRRG